MRGPTDYSYNLGMGNFSRNRHKHPATPPAPPQPLGASLPRLMPDIISARQSPTASRNGALPASQPVDPLEEISLIEARHPDIARAICLLWGYPEMNEYFDRIWIADGFHTPIDPDAMSELMMLARLHQAIVPQRPGRNLASILGSGRLHQHPSAASKDPWNDVPRRR